MENEGRLFWLTAKVLDLGHGSLSWPPLWTQAQPLIEDLERRRNGHARRRCLDADKIVYMVRLSAHRTMLINLGIGIRLPAQRTSMGRILLSGWTRTSRRSPLIRMQS